jgi:hypothetical protein
MKRRSGDMKKRCAGRNKKKYATARECTLGMCLL